MLLTVFFIAGPGLKVKTLCAGITISAPVVGLRPLRSLLVRTAKLPKFLIFTFSPRSKEALMISNVALDKIRRNPVHVSRGAAVEIGQVHAVRHKTASLHKLWLQVSCWEPSLNHILQNACSLSIEDSACKHDESVSALLACGLECSLNGPAVRPISLSRTYWGGRIRVIQ
jgi:hypothetical protein